MNSVKIIIAISILLLSVPDKHVSAQIKAGSVSLGAHAGWYVYDGEQDISNAPLHGIGLGYNFTENMGVEGTFDYIYSDSKPTDNNRNTYLYRFDGLYHFMADKDYVPYLAAGIGALSLNTQDNTDTNFLLNYGAGLKAFITDSLAIRGDVRHIVDMGDSYNNFAYTIGLTYFFGSREKKAAPALPRTDDDQDGVYDDLDQCPGTPLGVTVDNTGCPIDTDRDGVYDYLDKCPDTPPGVPVDNEGCPFDSDGDGVYDHLDKCPGTPPGLLVDDVGCRVLVKEPVSVELKVQFEFDSAKVKNIYHDHITKIVDFLKAHPETNVEIGGHTCSIGTEEYNLKLSQRRAESVIKLLIDSGIAPSRLTAKAYGESMPIADNNTRAGRRKNRRVTALISTVIMKPVMKESDPK